MRRSCWRDAGGKDAAWPEVAAGVALDLGGQVGELRHTITRYRITARLHEARLVGGLPERWRWFEPHELEELPLTGMARKVLQRRR